MHVRFRRSSAVAGSFRPVGSTSQLAIALAIALTIAFALLIAIAIALAIAAHAPTADRARQ